MQKKIKDDLNQLDSMQQDHKRNQEKFSQRL